MTTLTLSGAAPLISRAALRNPGLIGPLTLCVMGWAVLAGLAQSDSLALCLSPGAGALTTAIDAAFFYADPGRLATEWAAMVAAMMAPLAMANLAPLAARTAPRQKLAVTLAALTGYLLIWLGLGILAAPAILVLRSAASVVEFGPFLLIGVAYLPALIWAAMPARQTRLPALHRIPLLPCLEPVAHAFRYGLSHAASCAVSCLPLMLAPMIAGQGMIGMFVMAHILLAERLSPRPKTLPMRRLIVGMAVFAACALI